MQPSLPIRAWRKQRVNRAQSERVAPRSDLNHLWGASRVTIILLGRLSLRPRIHLKGIPPNGDRRLGPGSRTGCTQRKPAYRQRLQHHRSHDQRIGVAVVEQCAAKGHFWNGSSCKRKEPVPIEHCRASDMVHNPGQQGRLCGAQTRIGGAGGAEPRDGARGRDGAAAGRRGHLRREPEPEAVSRRCRLLSGALRQDHDRDLP